MSSMIVDFLAQIWPPIPLTFGEIRAISPGDRAATQIWVRRTSLGFDLAAKVAELNWQKRQDVYFGVLLRTRESGRAEDTLASTTVLWADVDAKAHAGSKPAALRAILWGSRIEPQIVVDSGGGYHGYWLLREPLPWELAERAMRAIAKRVGGDHVYDRPRILRLPGTWNWKPAVTAPARILRFDLSVRYLPAHLVPHPEEPRPPKAVPAVRQDAPAAVLRALDEKPPRGTRSEAIFRAVLTLVELGWSDDEIADTIAAAPIGEKVREMTPNQAERWMRRTIEAARR